jgi:tRNA1(Val) A37 N6-methylase TrmN6
MYVGPDSAALAAILAMPVPKSPHALPAAAAAAAATAAEAGTAAMALPGESPEASSNVVWGKRVLDLCSGGGVQGLTAAALGASFVRLVERSPRAARSCWARRAR